MQSIREDEGFRISPQIIFGCFALMFSFVAYIVSSTSLGKRSISHTWLFSGLLVIFPSEESLKTLAPTTSQEAVTPKRKNSTAQTVKGLELSCKPILPGAMPLSVMTEKKRTNFRQWQALDAAVCVWISCLIALAAPIGLAWYTLYRDKVVCCDNLKCWLKWWREQLGGAGLIFISTSPPAHSMLMFLAGLSLWFWWRLVIHATRLPAGGIFLYSPFSYINGWMTFFVTLFILQLTADTSSDVVIGQTRAFMGIPLTAALAEFSTRISLWVGLTGFYSPDADTSYQQVLACVLHLTHLAFAFTTCLLGFAIADPLRETMRLYWGNFCGDDVVFKDASTPKFLVWAQKTQRQYANLGVALLPVLCLSTYLVQLESFQHFTPRAIRAIISWCFVWNLGTLIRPLEQKYLLQALSAVDHLLETTKKLTVAEIQFPFENRSQKILSSGSQLLVFPAIILIVLTLGHGAGQLPVALSTTKGVTTGIYPFAFYQSLWTDQEEKDFEVWEEFQAKVLAQGVVEDDTFIADLTAARANIELCKENVSFSFLMLPGKANADSSSHLLDQYSAPIVQIDNASQLVPSRSLIKTTFIKILRKLQKLVKTSRKRSADLDSSEIASQSTSTPKGLPAKLLMQLEEEQANSQADLHSFIQALVFHPFLTSTVMLPVLDFYGLMLSFLWLMYFLWYGLRALPKREKRKRYVLQVKGEDCRVVAIQRMRIR